MRLQSKLTCVITLVAAIVTIFVVSVNSYMSVEEMRHEALEQNKRDLTSKRILVQQGIESYFDTIRKQLVVMANDVSIKQATRSLSSAFLESPVDLTNSASLENYYSTQYQKNYQELNADKFIAIDLLKDLDNLSKSMQIEYISENENPTGKKDALISSGSESAYDEFHSIYHSSIRKFLQEFDYHDIFIVEPESGYIVYSVFKEVDFATSLKSGPYRNSGIAEAFKKALSLNAGEVYLTDFMPYLPSYNNPASFISTPIVKNGSTIGILIFQMPIDRINSFMTQSQRWIESGFGNSGEIYLVGADKTLRNESRFFIEDKQNYIEAISQVGIAEAASIEKKGTSISLQPVNSLGVSEALDGKSGFGIFNDYRNVSVLSSYSPIKVLNHNWAILSEIDEAEAFHLVNEGIKKTIGTSVIILLIGLVGAICVAVVFSRQLTKPLDNLAQRFREITHGDADLTIRIPYSSVPEIHEIGQSFNVFTEQLQEIIAHIKDAVSTIASSGTELGFTADQTLQTINEQHDEVSAVKGSLESFSLSVAEIVEQTQETLDSTNTAKESAQNNFINAETAVSNIRHLVDEVHSSTNIILQLQQSVQGIGEVLTVINSIADQTNLLALNAAIEAARAGEHGRGFAVVADEVRTLASKTQESTVTIQKQIDELTLSTHKSVESMAKASKSAEVGIELVEKVKDTLHGLKNVVVELSQKSLNIAESSQSQSRTIEEINSNVLGLENRANEITESSNAISSVANQLSSVSEKVKLDVDRFKV